MRGRYHALLYVQSVSEQCAISKLLAILDKSTAEVVRVPRRRRRRLCVCPPRRYTRPSHGRLEGTVLLPLHTES